MLELCRGQGVDEMCEGKNGKIGSGSHLKCLPGGCNRNLEGGAVEGGEEGDDRYEEMIDWTDRHELYADVDVDDFVDMINCEWSIETLMDDTPSGDDGSEIVS